MKKLTFCLLLAVCLGLTAGCGGKADSSEAVTTAEESTVEEISESSEAYSQPTSEEVSEDISEDDPSVIVLGEKEEKSKFTIVYSDKDAFSEDSVDSIRNAIKGECGRSLKLKSDSMSESDCEIIINSQRRSICKEVMDQIKFSEYAIKTVKTEEKSYIILAYKGELAARVCTERFIEEFILGDGDTVEVPNDTYIKDNCSTDDAIIETGVRLRDPCILYDNGMYYMYGTGWNCSYSKQLDSGWSPLQSVAIVPQGSESCYWAPEVHKYNGAYYMFATYFSSKTQHRGCTILKADNPLGPFVEISDGLVTPDDWDAIDGTLYVDDEGQPWMVFVHEWTSMPDSIGSFAVAKLSDDLTHFISEPVELFKAKDVEWAVSGVTDGCWIYKCEDGSLIMLWSNFSANGYVVATAKSESGDITGPWVHSEKLLYEKSLIRNQDGGHGMIFTAEDGKMYLSLHSPNTETETTKIDAVLIRVEEQYGELKLNFWEKQ